MVDQESKEPGEKRSESAPARRASEDDDEGEFKPGQVLACRIVGRNSGGYKVLIRSRIPGFFETTHEYKIGQELNLQFNHFDHSRAVLTECDESAGRSSGTGTVRMDGAESDSTPDDTSCDAGAGKLGVDSFQSCRGTEVAKEDVVNFRRKLHCRRATDLIMPPIDNDNIFTIVIGDYDLQWLLGDLENASRTGCLRASCESRLSRSAMLLYKGKSVGCIYGRKTDPVSKPTDVSITMMLDDLESPDTVISVYDLPEPVVVAMSALFLGNPVERNDRMSTKEYMDHICERMAEEKATAAMAFSFTAHKNTCLGLIFEGEYVGAFSVGDQKFIDTKDHMQMLIDWDSDVMMEVSVLPKELASEGERFGFSLSGYRDR